MADKKGQSNDYFHPINQKPEKTGFKNFLWNPDTKQFLGRTGTSWAKIGIFYVIFYICLTAFFAAMLWVFYQTLDVTIPKWTQNNGLIGTNPGLGFRPMPSEKNVDSTLVWFRHGNSGNWHPWTDQLTDFLETYEQPGESGGAHFTTCSFDKGPSKDQACKFDIKDLGNDCTKSQQYGYALGRPCIILKLNRIYGWTPDYYNSSKELPENMPEQLAELIRGREKESLNQLNMVWISCEGENPADRENIGRMDYRPHQGFPGYYFPYLNVPGYLSPLVAVQFIKPQTGILINIECKARAKNIFPNRQDRLGSVHFELMVD